MKMKCSKSSFSLFFTILATGNDLLGVKLNFICAATQSSVRDLFRIFTFNNSACSSKLGS